MKILATADWHIGDQPCNRTVNGLNARAVDTEERITRMTEEARGLRPDLIVISGDIFHASRTWSSRGIREVQFACDAINALAATAPVVVLRGTPNHDGAEHFEMLKQYFSHEPNVHIYTEPGQHNVVCANGETASICALPGFDKGYWRAQHPGVDKEDESLAMSDALEQMITGMKAMGDPALPSILVGHYTIDGCNTESGQTMMFSRFEPTVSQKALAVAGYDLALFGHIHRPQQLGKAFYAGAVNALNFNDEGQDRGYWVHELQGHTLTGSEFHSLHPREFRTFRLNDGQIDAFNLTGMVPEDMLNCGDCIVRVLYNCTDEHNRAFNRAQLEALLYSCGAFWVQDITPEQITITANHDALTGDTSPEANLRAWLLEKGVDEAEIEAMMPQAREIIAATVKPGSSEKPHGLFVPVEISVTNYRNYREETFNFDDVQFCTINGVNGAGKSSLFCDAIYDALYESPREGDLTGWICNDPSVKSGAIRFTFRVGEHTWRVSRTRTKSGKATLNLSELVDGEWQDRSREKMRDTQAEIERVVGMDGLTLRACALIMQDQYGLFLQADKEDRMKILSDVLGLQIYDEMATHAADRATEVNRQLRQLQGRKDEALASMPDVDAAKADIEQINADLASNRLDTEEVTRAMDDTRTLLASVTLAEQQEAALKQEEAALTDEYFAKNDAWEKACKDLEAVQHITGREAEIHEGAAQHRENLSKRDELQTKIMARKQLQMELEVKQRELQSLDSDIANRARQADAAEARVAELDKQLARKPHLEADAAKLDEAKARIAAFDEARTKRGELQRAYERAKADSEHYLGNANYELSMYKMRIDDLQRQTDLLKSSGCPNPETATCKFLMNAREAAEQLPKLTAERDQYQEESDGIWAEYDIAEKHAKAELDALPPENPNDRAEAEWVIMYSTEACAELKLMDRYAQERDAKQAEAGKLRGECEAMMEQRRATAEAVDRMKLSIDMSAHLVTEYDTAYAMVEKTRSMVEMEPRLEAMKEREAMITERIRECLDAMRAISAKQEELRPRISEAHKRTGDGPRLRNQLQLMQDELTGFQRRRDLLIGRLAERNSTLETAKRVQQNVDDLSAQIAEQSQSASRYELLKAAFGSNGIPHSIVRSVVPVLEATATNILSQMSGGRMSVELVTEKVLKSNSKKEVVALDIVINDAVTGRLPYMSRSGGERVKASLSVILALSEIKSTGVGVQVGFLCLDESPYLDPVGVQAYCDALETIQRRYSWKKIIAITHDESFKARFPQSVTIIKDETGSHVVLN